MSDPKGSPAPHTDYNRFIPRGRVMQWMSRLHVWLYRLSGGRLGSYMDRLHILLLTSRGRRSGRSRTTPLPYFRDGDRFVSVGSNGGRPRHPAWVHNVRANPEVTLQVRGERFRARAREAEGEERERLWKRIVSEQPRYGDYQAMTERRIPVVVFERIED